MANDRDILRRLAGRWMEIAGLPIMDERKRQWTALHDLKQERPMVLFETWTIENYIAQDELECEDPGLRWVELTMRWNIRQFEEVGDDIVLEPGVAAGLSRGRDRVGRRCAVRARHRYRGRVDRVPVRSSDQDAGRPRPPADADVLRRPRGHGAIDRAA